MNKIIAFLFLLVSISSYEQTPLLIEDFNSGIPATWTIVDGDGLIPDTQVSEFTNAWISYETISDTSAASTSFYSPAGQSIDYLISPKLSIATFTNVVWRAKSLDASYPDGYHVLISTTDSLSGSFTDTLLTIDSESANWTTRSIDLDLSGYANQDVYIAFLNNTNDGYILLVDDFGVYVSDFASNSNPQEAPILSIYPNPVNETLFIQSNSEENFTVRVLSIEGKELLTSKDSQIDVSSLENGTYFLVYENEGKTITKSFVKI